MELNGVVRHGSPSLCQAEQTSSSLSSGCGVIENLPELGGEQLDRRVDRGLLPQSLALPEKRETIYATWELSEGKAEDWSSKAREHCTRNGRQEPEALE